MKPESRGRAIGLAILLAGLAHDTIWQSVERALQGPMRGLTQLLPVMVLAFFCARGWRDPHVSAACLAVFLMGTTTAACSAGWFVVRWTDWRCTETFQNWTTVLSCWMAALCLARWRKQ